ncbi:hypothetical protein MLD38_018367 [Melastoma candidum]|uniref:Uncharacterized protein n=1 Tax=Melastoma candidum TaxID=119954 RepID=A0ACB9QXN5_9MYRT|nr:hypothetical protein MLD38_018367 [Melastoma candidum]
MEVAAGNDRVTTLVASLSSGFARVHLSAVPSMMDCVLSSTGTSPSLLFESLLGSFSNAFEEVGNEEWSTDSKKCKYFLAWFCSISHLVKDIEAHGDCFQIYTWKAFVPLTKKAYVVDQEMLRQIITLFLGVVVEMDAWKDLGISLVPFLLKSIRVPTEKYVGYNCSDESTSSTAVENENIGGPLPPGYFGLSLSCHILSETLDAALSSGEYPPPRLSSLRDRFACDLLPDLCFVAERLLLQSLEYRASAISILLPAIFKAFTSEMILRSLTQGLPLSIFWRHFPEKIWNCCRKMFSFGYLERRDAYRVLSLYLSFSKSTETSKYSIKSQMGEFDIRDQKEFWDEMKRGLVDKDSLLRKQAFHMLKGVIGIAKENQEYSAMSGSKSGEKHLNTRTLTKRELWAEKEAQSLGVGRESEFSDSSHINHQMWGAFLLLCQMLEEYGTHLVEAAWNHQVSSLLHFSISNNGLESCNGNTEIPNKIISSELPVWLAILWQRGFHHDNPQVRCLILESFLSIDWSQFGRCVIALDESFILGPLIQGLNDPVHHEDFGVRGVYSSIILEGAAQFFYHYTGHLDVRVHANS